MDEILIDPANERRNLDFRPLGITPERAGKFADLLKAHPTLITNNRLGDGYPLDSIPQR